MYLIIILVVLATLTFLHSKRKYSYWSNFGIPGPSPIFPLGNYLTRSRRVPNELEIEWMKKYGKFYGIYNGLNPALVILEPELIKQVMVKDFPHFINRFKFPVFNELWNQNLLFSTDDQWKRLRTITTPAFTSGKLKAMHSIMNQCVHKLVTYFNTVVDKKNGIIDTKEVITGFSIDIIASTVFATETDANNDRIEKNPIIVNGRNLFNIFPIRRAAILLLPKKVLHFFGIKDFLDPKPFNYFTNLIKHILSERQNQKGLKNDLVQLFLEAKANEEELDNFQNNFSKLTANGEESSFLSSDEKLENISKKKLSLSESEIIASCIFIFAAGFETVSTTISHIIFELANNLEVQGKLYKELNELLSNLSEDSSEYFEAVMNKAIYLDAVVKESLRMHSPVTRLNRMANTDGYELNGVRLFANQWIIIPIAALHYCPDFYEEPHTFNPDRFLPENRHKLVPYTFLPFGAGPRNCIGIRFAFQELKLCLALIVSKFSFNTTPDTPKKLIYKKGSAFLEPNEFPIQLSKR